MKDEPGSNSQNSRKNKKTTTLEAVHEQDKTRVHSDKKKKKYNLWPLKALVLSVFVSFAVNAASELVLEDAQLWLAIVLTVVILLFGVIFDMIGTAATSCDMQPFLAMASRKIKGGKTAVKLAKSADVVSSICNDVVGDICGIVSGVCAAAIAISIMNPTNFFVNVLISTFISTATITLKAIGKGYAVNNANKIVFAVARMLSIFNKEG